MTESIFSYSGLSKAIHSLKSNKNHEHDDIDSMIVKYFYDEIKVSILYLLDFSLNKGIFPENLKIANVVSVHKSGCEKDMGNYCRPIYVLSCFSKIFERLIYNRLYEFLTQ